MPSKDERNKQKRRLREQKRASAQRRRLAAIQHANRFPRIIVEPAGGDPEFVNEVQRILSDYSFEDPACCEEDCRNNFELIASSGLTKFRQYFYDGLLKAASDRNEASAVMEKCMVDLHCHLGEWLFKRLPQHFTAAPLPTYFFRTVMGEREIRVRFDLLQSVGEPANPIYVLPGNATVEMQGVKWQVGLYHHALERLCQRLNGDGDARFTRNMHLHCVLTQSMLAYKPVALADGSEALRVDFSLPLTTVYYGYYASFARRVLGLPDDHRFKEKDDLLTVLGYLPLLIQGKYARAKTFLLPGFAKTPEHALMDRIRLTPAERVLLQRMTDESRRTDDIDGETVRAIKWYHDNGVPQVFPRTQH
jgi:hypothetical protein